MRDCEHLTTTLAYFDGALEPAREAEALEHLATCAICQGGLGDAVSIDAALSQAPRADVPLPAPPVRRPWWPKLALAGGLVAAAATIYLVVRPRGESATQVAIELPRERALEARFTGERFAPHRPYGALRGDRAVEPIAIADLARLEERRETRDLIAALAATGNLARARELAAALPADAGAEADRAALALAGDDAERALEHAFRATSLDPTLHAGWWNLGLAARAHGLARVARAAFQHVADGGEPGWADEARAQIAALDRDLAPELEYPRFVERAQAMLAGGTPIEVADVQRFPAAARMKVLDAIRVASGPRLEELRPLARALDAISGTPTVTAALERAAAADPALRARFADRYRAVLGGTASEPEIVKLIDELGRAGKGVDDLRAGAIIAGSQVDKRLAELKALAGDPWIDLVTERVRILVAHPPGDMRAIPALTAALAACTTDAWSLRCGQLAQELSERLFVDGRTPEAERWAARAVELYRRGVAPAYVQTARALLADIHRNLGRLALARAEVQEVMLAAETTHCGLRRHTAIALSSIELERGDWAAVRATLPAPAPEPGCETYFEIQALGTAVDLARATKTPEDVTRARTWIETASGPADPNRDAITLVAAARLARGADPAASEKLRAWLASQPISPEAPWPSAIRTWGYTTLIADAGTRGDWNAVVELAVAEHPGAARAACALVASLDDTELTVAARTPAGTIGEHRAIVKGELATLAIVPPAIAKALATCSEIAVDARPPLHGRADLLPAELPWWFAGDAPAHPRASGAARAIEVTSPRPPDDSLPALPAPGPSAGTFEASLAGPDATPSRVLAALADATYAELHAHGIASATDDAAFLALSPDPDGAYALRASTVRQARLARAPIVVLAACRAAAVAPYLSQRWSLPDALLLAGAHAVVAVDVPIPDPGARRVFDELHRRIDAGEPVHAALAAIRAAAATGAWERHLMLFR